MFSHGIYTNEYIHLQYYTQYYVQYYAVRRKSGSDRTGHGGEVRGWFAWLGVSILRHYSIIPRMA